MLDDKRFEIEQEESWREWCDQIPYLNFPEEWKIKIIPPFSGALIRFVVKYKEKTVSVYLDVYQALGIAENYWEIYPYKDDTYRCGIDETNKLISKINEELNREN